MNHSNLLRSNILWLLAERILRLLLTVLTNILLAGYLGPSQYGLLAWGIAIINIASVIIQLGIEPILIKELKQGADQSSLLGSAFGLKLCAAFLSIITIAIWAILNNEPQALLIILLSLSLLWSAFNVLHALFQSQMKSRFLFWILNTQLIASSVLKIIAILQNAPLMGFAYIYAFDGIAAVITALFIYYKRQENVTVLHFDLATSRQLLLRSWPLLLSGICIALYTRVDILLLESNVSSALLGNYCFTVALIESFFFIPYAISNAFFPILQDKEDPQQPKRAQQLFDCLILSGLICLVLVNVIGIWFIPALLGASYQMVASIVPIYGLRVLFGFIGWGMERWLITQNLQIFSLYRTAMGLLVGILLNLLLIPLYSLQGAAIAAVTCSAVSSFLSLGCFPQSRPGFFLTIKSFNLKSSLTRILNLIRNR